MWLLSHQTDNTVGKSHLLMCLTMRWWCLSWDDSHKINDEFQQLQEHRSRPGLSSYGWTYFHDDWLLSNKTTTGKKISLQKINISECHSRVSIIYYHYIWRCFWFFFLSLPSLKLAVGQSAVCHSLMFISRCSFS